MTSETKQATAEAVIIRIKDEDLDEIELLFSAAADHDAAIWRETLRYEMKISYLMEEILKWNIVVPKLIMHDITTMSPFHFAALRGADAVLERFLRLDIPVDMCLQNGSTALHLACFANKPETVTLLVDTFNADINRTDRYGWTSLHYASIEGNFSIVEYLIERGVNVGARDKDGTTAAFRAKECGHLDVVCLLESTGVDDQLLVAEEEMTSADYIESIYSQPSRPGIFRNNGRNNTNQESERQDLSQYERVDLSHLQNPGNVVGSGAVQDCNVAINGGAPKVLSSTGSNESEDRAAKLRGFISKELQNVFEDDTYERSSSGDDQKQYDDFLTGIGMNTMTNVLRQEFMKFKQNSLPNAKPPPTSETKVEKKKTDYDDDDEVYERIGPPTLSGKRVDAVPAPSYPPPLPPPRSSVSSDSPRNQPTSMQVVDTNSSPEKKQALTVLHRIEHSSAVMDACFKVLSDRLYGDDWKRLAYALPLRNGHDKVERQIKLIEKRQPNSKSQTLAALTDWRYNCGEKATVEELIIALNKCGLGSIVADVERASDDFEA